MTTAYDYKLIYNYWDDLKERISDAAVAGVGGGGE
jgi:hypothetical protein